MYANQTVGQVNLTTAQDPSLLDRLKRSRTWVQWANWEYWPIWAANLPLAFIVVWFALRARRLFFFSAVNPVIETGGAWGESKFNILQRMPRSHVPPTVFVEHGVDFQQVVEKMKTAGLDTWPVIAKPDIGERGFLVTKIRDEAHLRAFMSKKPVNFLIQGFVDMPLELAVMCHRMPGSSETTVSSICVKETLKVTGDGQASIRQLMQRSERATLQLDRFEAERPDLLRQVPAPGQTLELEPIGNHCRGTMFLNGNHHIDPALTAVFGAVLSKMDGIHYGRFDMKCQSIEHLRSTGTFQAVEFNGIGAEPAHIYDPSYPVWKKYRDIYRHWKVIFKIYKLQKANGVRPMSLQEGIERLRNYSNYKKSLSNT